MPVSPHFTGKHTLVAGLSKTLALLVLLTLSLAVQAQNTTALPAEFRQVCYAKDDHIYLRDLKTGKTSLIRKGYDPRLSPSGKFLAFTAYVKGKNPNDSDRTIQVLNLETRQVQGFKALTGFQHAYGAIWSPDETNLAFNILAKDDWRVGVLNLASGELKMLGSGHLGSWLPDSKSIVSTDLSFVYEIELTGKVAQKISVQDWPEKVSGISSGTRFSFSSDRRYLLFDSQYPDVPGSIHLYDVTQKKFTQVTPPKVDGGSPQWLPGEKEIVFERPRKTTKGGYAFDLYKIALGQTTPVLLLRDVSYVSFSR
jgi:Tol biopolymer transport system component